MRVTQFTFYNNFVLNQQSTLSKLVNTQNQISTGKKITYSYDDPVVFLKDLDFKEEINSLDQVNKSANFAKTFANETDTTINDIVLTLDSFKTKLLQAANDTQNATSREGIVSDLKGMLEHLKDLANTSIDGKYIFSGSAFNVKPIDDNYKYQGNSQYVKAFLGKDVEREYNIPGSEIFLGRDLDYQKHMSVNVIQYDKMKQHKEFVVRGRDGKLYIDKNIVDDKKIPADTSPNENVPITADSEIRMLTGVSDIYDKTTDTYSDGTSYFYIKGRKPNGEVVDTKFSLSNSDKVSDLLEKIGEAYGNTATSKVVDVSVNNMGEIQIKDLNSGKIVSDFYMVASDKDEASIEDLVKNGDYIVQFQKSNFNSEKILEKITANNGYFDNRIFEFASNFKLDDDSRDALPEDKLTDVFGSTAYDAVNNKISQIDHITISGTDTNGALVSVDVPMTGTMQDIIDAIKNNFGNVDVSLKDGKLEIVDNDAAPGKQSKLSVSMTAYDANGNELQAFRAEDYANYDKLRFQKDGNEVFSNSNQIVKDRVTYFENGVLIKLNDKAQTYATNDTQLMEVAGNDNVPKTIDFRYKDINGVYKRAEIVLQDDTDADGHKSYFYVDTNGDGVLDTKYDIYDEKGNKTPAHEHIDTVNNTDIKGVTYRQLSDVMEMIVTDNFPAGSSFEDYKNALNKAQQEVSIGLDDKGRLKVTDKTTNSTKMEVSLSTDDDSLTFQTNDAITIDSPEVDFFQTLQDAIKAVENGTNYPDSNSPDPRNFAIQGAIEAIDHVSDHVRRAHAKIGGVSNEFDMTISRTETLKVQIQDLKSTNIDTDIGEATMRLNQLSTSYQALLASIAKVNNLTLLNYLR